MERRDAGPLPTLSWLAKRSRNSVLTVEPGRQSRSDRSGSSPNQVKQKHYYREDQKDMNEPCRNMERYKSEQPQYDKHRSNYCKHLNLLLHRRTLTRCELSRCVHQFLREHSRPIQKHYQVSSVLGGNFAGTMWDLLALLSS
jgi:hypothetical protein